MKGRQLRHMADKYYVSLKKGQGKEALPFFKKDGNPMFVRHTLNLLRANKAVVEDSS